MLFCLDAAVSSGFAVSPVGGLIARREARERFIIVDVNEAARASGGWQGVTVEQARGKSIVELFPGIRDSPLIDLYNRALDEQRTVSLGDLEYQDVDGNLVDSIDGLRAGLHVECVALGVSPHELRVAALVVGWPLRASRDGAP